MVVAILTATFLPAALMERHHISIGFLGKWLGPAWNKALDVFAALVTFGFFTIMAWQFIGYTRELGEAGETTWILQIKVQPYWWVVTVFVIACVPVQLVVLWRIIRRRNA